MDARDSNWTRACGASAACLEAMRSGPVIHVQDSKNPAQSGGPLQVWEISEWQELLEAIKRHDVHHSAVDWLTRYQAGEIVFGLEWHDPLTFTGVEWDAFIAGVDAGEFDIDKLSTPVPVSGESQVAGEVGPGANGPNLAATGAGGDESVPGVPVPVAAHAQGYAEAVARLRDDERYLIAVNEASEVHGRIRHHLADYLEAVGPPVPVAAQPRYILDKDAILELVQRYGEAERDAADSFLSPDRKMAARDEADDLLRAIRAALTPVPVVEPEPAWGSGPLVKPIPETPAPAAADPDGLRTQREMDADLYENWVANQETPEQSAAIVDANLRRMGSQGLVKPISETPGTGTAICDTCDGKGVIACYGSYSGGPTACIDCHGTGEMPCPDCPGTGSADPEMPYLTGRPASYVDGGDGQAVRS